MSLVEQKCCFAVWVEVPDSDQKAVRSSKLLRVVASLIKEMLASKFVDEIVVVCKADIAAYIPEILGSNNPKVKYFEMDFRGGFLEESFALSQKVGKYRRRQQSIIAKIARCLRRRKPGESKMRIARRLAVPFESSLRLLALQSFIVFERAKHTLRGMYISVRSNDCVDSILKLDARKRVWIVPHPSSAINHRFTGRRVLLLSRDACGFRESPSDDPLWSVNQRAVETSVKFADRIVCYSDQSKKSLLSKYVATKVKNITVRLPPIHDIEVFGVSRSSMSQRLGDHVLETKMNRHFCDFPFSSSVYVFASLGSLRSDAFSDAAIAYAKVLRLFRRSMKLIIESPPREPDDNQQFLIKHGLVFDVLEVSALDLNLRSAVIQHAACFVLTCVDEESFLLDFILASQFGVPVVAVKNSWSQEILQDDLDYPEFFSPESVDSIAQSIQFAVDYSEEVVVRQKEMVSRIVARRRKEDKDWIFAVAGEPAN